MTITNDGATILKQMQVLHPAAKMASTCNVLPKRDAVIYALPGLFVFVLFFLEN